MSPQPLKIFTWLWVQEPVRDVYDLAHGAEAVNRWAAMFRQYLTLPHTLACVTNIRGGFDQDIELIPLPTEFEEITIRNWSERSGAPQCLRRLSMFHPDAARIFGAERFVSTDIDMIATDVLDPLYDHDHDFRMFGGTSSRRPYNGSMVQMTAGCRPEVYERFAADPEGVARAARAMYVGSDQAVISMILGKGEKIWSKDDGVYAYSPRFARNNRVPASGGRSLEVGMPEGMRMMFFPGFDKPWQIDKFKHSPWIPDVWYYGTKPVAHESARAAERIKRKRRAVLWAYDDRKQWGRMFARACAGLPGTKARMFIRADRPPADARCFVRLDQSGPQRDVSRQMVFDLAERGAITLPTVQEATWYDDKVAQLPALAPWMPPTRVITDEAEAIRAAAVLGTGRTIAGGIRLPFVSKAAEGASSANVRVIRTEAEAREEIARAFGAGIAITHGRRQVGYVYWQRLVPDQTCDYRVCIVGPYWYGLVRGVRPGTIKASGSGILNIMWGENRRETQAAALCIEIADALNTRWMAFDCVFEKDGAPKVLEMSSAWTMKAYEACPMFDRSMRTVGKTAADSFKVAVDVLKQLPQAGP